MLHIGQVFCIFHAVFIHAAGMPVGKCSIDSTPAPLRWEETGTPVKFQKNTVPGVENHSLPENIRLFRSSRNLLHDGFKWKFKAQGNRSVVDHFEVFQNSSPHLKTAHFSSFKRAVNSSFRKYFPLNLP